MMRSSHCCSAELFASTSAAGYLYEPAGRGQQEHWSSLGSQGTVKKNSKPLQLATEDSIRAHRTAVVKDLEKRLYLRDDVFPHGQQSTTCDENLARRLQGPSNDTPIFNYAAQDVSKEYKISNFEQRLMNEIEFRLERTPVDESDDEIEHDEIPTGKYIAPIFDKRLKHFRVLEGQPATFTCKIVGIPVPKVYWFKDGKQISKKNQHFKMSREGDGTCSLHIEATTNDDDGNYTFMAANPQGRISCSGHLMVQTPPIRSRLTTAIQPHRGRSRISEGDKEPIQERFFRPYFLQAPGDMVAHEGRLCRLDCKVSGLPPPDLMWLLNGKPVLPDTTHKMLVRETGVHSLLIDPITQNDAGIYTCLATNKTGQNSISLELSVVEKEVKKAPVILEKLQNCGVPEGHLVRLECRVIGMPPPVFYWKKDNETIPANRERMSMHQDATGYVCLLIQPAKKVDAGWYTLSAKNEAGIVSCTARLDIYAQWHQQIPQPIKIRPGGTRYTSLPGQGLDIFSAFSTVENPARFSSPSQRVVEKSSTQFISSNYRFHQNEERTDHLETGGKEAGTRIGISVILQCKPPHPFQGPVATSRETAGMVVSASAARRQGRGLAFIAPAPRPQDSGAGTLKNPVASPADVNEAQDCALLRCLVE
ncbi:Myopalladin [Varanus komodoensis]|nr:Myopalladin [Varanus komodoensis]